MVMFFSSATKTESSNGIDKHESHWYKGNSVNDFAEFGHEILNVFFASTIVLNNTIIEITKHIMRFGGTKTTAMEVIF